MSIKFRSITLLCAVSLTISSCATKPKNIAPSYVSPLIYETYDCAQMAAESERVSARVTQITGVQSKKATGDAVAMGVGLVLFWPALFFIKGDGATEGEVARLKGEMETIEKVSIQKNCGFQFQREKNEASDPPKNP